MMKKILMTLLLSISLINNAYGVDDCADIEQAAKQTVTSANRVIDLRVKEIKAQDDIITLQSKQIMDLQNQNDSLLRDPKFIFVIGVLAGFAAVSLASKVTH